jgi:hypothetical protein
MGTEGSLFHRWWRRVSDAGTIITFLQVFGYWPSLVSLLVAAVTFLAGWLEEIPLSLLVVAVWSSFAATAGMMLAIRATWARHKDKARVGPSYEAWDHVEELAVFQAACLWAGLEPVRLVPPGEAYARFRMIKEALRKQEIAIAYPAGVARVFSGSEPQVDQETLVTRAELRKLAERRSMRPAFLYTEDRL